nr:hypothetical protein [Tanacetum cinerariifolium]
MFDDELRSVLGFESDNSDNLLDNKVSTYDHIVQDNNASAERISIPDHMDHICEEVSFLHSKLGDIESSIAEIKSSLPTLLRDMKDLFELVVIIDETAKGEKKKKDENAIPASTLEEHQTAENITTLEPTPKTERGLLSKNQLYKLKTSVKQLTDQLFGTTSSKFSPSSPEELNPPRDESKRKGIATEKPPRGKLVSFQVEGGSNLKIPNIKSFITPTGLFSQEKTDEKLKELKRLTEKKKRKRVEFVKEVFVTEMSEWMGWAET